MYTIPLSGWQGDGQWVGGVGLRVLLLNFFIKPPSVLIYIRVIHLFSRLGNRENTGKHRQTNPLLNFFIQPVFILIYIRVIHIFRIGETQPNTGLAQGKHSQTQPTDRLFYI